MTWKGLHQPPSQRAGNSVPLRSAKIRAEGRVQRGTEQAPTSGHHCQGQQRHRRRRTIISTNHASAFLGGEGCLVGRTPSAPDQVVLRAALLLISLSAIMIVMAMQVAVTAAPRLLKIVGELGDDQVRAETFLRHHHKLKRTSRYCLL